MILRTDKLNVTIKDVTFHSAPNPDAPKDFFLDVNALAGWNDGVGARRQVTQRPTSDGDFPDKATMASRIVTITGAARALTTQGLHEMRDQFIGLLADGEYTEMAVENLSGTRYATVGQENTPSWVQLTDTFASFKLDLFQPNPRIYGVQRSVSISGEPTETGGLFYQGTSSPYYLSYPLDYSTDINHQTLSIFNYGNVASWPVFTVTGNFVGGFTITDNLGHNITYTGDTTLFAGVTIDSFAGTATQNGQDRSILLTERDWFSIPPNQTVQPSFKPVNGASGWCDILFRDTWI